MGEQECISKLRELNGVILIYSQNILNYTDRIGETTEYKVVITERMIKVLLSRVIQLKEKRDKIEYTLINNTIEKVQA